MHPADSPDAWSWSLPSSRRAPNRPLQDPMSPGLLHQGKYAPNTYSSSSADRAASNLALAAAGRLAALVVHEGAHQPGRPDQRRPHQEAEGMGNAIIPAVTVVAVHVNPPFAGTIYASRM